MERECNGCCVVSNKDHHPLLMLLLLAGSTCVPLCVLAMPFFLMVQVAGFIINGRSSNTARQSLIRRAAGVVVEAEYPHESCLPETGQTPF